jgi:hypothetical protein
MAPPADSILYSSEKHFKNVRQLTFAADNAEAYFSFDNKTIIKHGHKVVIRYLLCLSRDLILKRKCQK